MAFLLIVWTFNEPICNLYLICVMYIVISVQSSSLCLQLFSLLLYLIVVIDDTHRLNSVSVIHKRTIILSTTRIKVSGDCELTCKLKVKLVGMILDPLAKIL